MHVRFPCFTVQGGRHFTDLKHGTVLDLKNYL